MNFSGLVQKVSEHGDSFGVDDGQMFLVAGGARKVLVHTLTNLGPKFVIRHEKHMRVTGYEACML